MAVVGIGIGGSYGAMLHKNPDVEFAAMCALERDALDKRLELYAKELGAHPAAYTSVTEMLAKEKLDGVIVSTPSGTHHKVAREVVEAGVNVLIDKPLDISSASMDAIQSAVEKAGVLAGVIYPERCKPVNRGVKKALESGLLGRPLICDIRLKWYRDQAYYDRGGWRGTWAMDGGGSLMNQGAHPMDLLCWLMGRPKTAMGEYAALAHDIETEDWASGVVVFESGARAAITTTTCVSPKDDTIWLEVHGTEGSVFVKNGAVEKSSVPDIDKLDPYPFAHPADDFVDAVKNGRPPLVPLREARWSVDLINGVYRSCREGRRVEL